MKKILHLLLLVLLFQACSLFKPSITEKVIDDIPEKQIEFAVKRSVHSLLANQWVSDFLLENNTRPTIAVSKVSNKTTANLNLDNIYDMVDLNLIQSGQVRVIKTNHEQRSTKPEVLASGQSIDFALSVFIEKKERNNAFNNTFILSLWDGKSSKPVTTVEIEIE